MDLISETRGRLNNAPSHLQIINFITMKQTIKSPEDIRFDDLMSCDKKELAEAILENEDRIEELKDLMKSEENEVDAWREKWVDAVDEMHAYETLLKLAKKEIKKLERGN